MEEVLLHPGASPQMPFRFRRTGQSPSERLVSSEHQWDHSIFPEGRRWYCIWVRVMLGGGGGDQSPPSHVWGGCLITDILQEAWPEDQITKAVILSPGEAILFFSRCSRNKGLPYCRGRSIELGLGGPFSWPGRPAQIEASMKTMQEGCHAMIKAVVEKKTKARRPGQPQGKAKPSKTPAVASDIKEWMQDLEVASSGEPKWNNDTDCRADQQSIHSQWGSQGQRRCRWQRATKVPR